MREMCLLNGAVSYLFIFINSECCKITLFPRASVSGRFLHNLWNVTDLESNDSYSLTMDQEGASPHSRYLHGDTSTPPYLSSPSHPLPYSGEPYPPLGESSEGSSPLQGNLLPHPHYLVKWPFVVYCVFFSNKIIRKGSLR